MVTIRQCATCGAVLIEGVPEGQCPKCLIQLGLKAGVASPDDPSDGGFGLLPREFGDFTLLEEIARGGMGVVYRARQRSLDRIVAVKLILSGHFAGKDSIHRFRTEASAAAALQHPNIVAIHEVGVHQGEHYLSMDLVEGPNLAQFVKNTPLPAPLAARYLKTIAEAIHYAHERGILHRDLKPSNIIIDAHDQPRVTDFGLAKRLNVGQASRLPPAGFQLAKEPATSTGETPALLSLTLTGQVLGSPNYVSPEQASGKRGQVCRQSDVYSLGAILYHLLTGRGPFVSDTLADTLHQVLHEEPVAPRLLNPRVPRDVETICLKCLQKEPARRYATAQKLADELDHFLKDEPIQARPITAVGKAWRWCRRKPALAGSLSTVSLLLIVVVIGSPLAAYRVNRERQRAERNAVKTQRVAQFLMETLKDMERSVRSGQSALVATQLDKNVERLDNDLKDQPEVNAALRQRVAEVYLDLGEYTKAEMVIRKALALQRTLFRNEHPDVAESLYALAVALDHQRGRDTEAEALLREALAMQKKFLGDEDPYVARSQIELADVLVKQGRQIEAAGVCLEGLAMARKSARNDVPKWEVRLFDLADLLYRQRSYEASEPLFRELLASVRTRLSTEHDDVLGPTASLARMLSDWAWEEVMYHRRSPLTTNIDLPRTGKASAPYERARESEALLRECLAIRLRGTNSNHWRTGELKTRLGGAQMSVAVCDPSLGAENRQTKLAEAEALLLEGNQRLQQSNSADRKYKRDALERLVRLYDSWEVFAPNTGKSWQAQEWREKLDAFLAEGGDGLEKYKLGTGRSSAKE